MLVHWDYSDQDLLSSNIEDIELLLGELIRVRRLGYHLVSISRTTTSWLLSNISLSAFIKTQLEMFAREYTQTGNLWKKANLYIEISKIDHDYENVSAGKIPVSMRFIVRSGILEKPKLILENIDNDGWFIDFVVNNVRGIKQFPTLAYQRLHGGGRDVLRVLGYEIENRSMVCLFMDSDKKYPGQTDDEKIALAKGVCRDSSWPFGFVYPTPCHEIENLLPYSLVSEMAKYDQPDTINIIRTINEYDSENTINDLEHYWRWFDVKNGYNENQRKGITQEAINWHNSKISSVFSGVIHDLDGFGEYLIQRISRENALKALLSRRLNSDEWPVDFRNFFTEIAWIFAAQRRTVT